MVVTQLHAVKSMPYLISNSMALLTCLPMAVGILVFGKSFSGLFENRVLLVFGSVSYEIYLVHAFTLRFVHKPIIGVYIFLTLTWIFAYILHVGMEIMRNDRFNGSYLNKK